MFLLSKSSKMVTCKHCGAEIAANAKSCPKCGGINKKPFYKKWWFWLIVAVILICPFFGNGSEGGEESLEVSSAVSESSGKNASSTDEPSVQESDDTAEKQDPSVPTEYKSALKKAETYCNLMHMSKAAIYDQLVSEYGEQFSTQAAEYAIDHLEADWNANALAKAETYSDTMHMSKAAIYDQLVSEYGEKFTPEEAQYAVDHIEADWNANALEKAKTYQESMNMSPEAIRDQLSSEYGEKFTQEEADYAVEHLE